jgi:hypothetical protein
MQIASPGPYFCRSSPSHLSWLSALAQSAWIVNLNDPYPVQTRTRTSRVRVYTGEGSGSWVFFFTSYSGLYLQYIFYLTTYPATQDMSFDVFGPRSRRVPLQVVVCTYK